METGSSPEDETEEDDAIEFCGEGSNRRHTCSPGQIASILSSNLADTHNTPGEFVKISNDIAIDKIHLKK